MKRLKNVLVAMTFATMLASSTIILTGCESNAPLPDYESVIENATLQYLTENEDFEYNVYDSYVEITKYIGKSTDVKIPSEIEDLPVYVIGSFGSTNKESSTITSVTIPYGVGIISENAFSYCFSLQDVSMPNSVVEIEDGAFAFCSALRSIKLSENLKSIGGNAFLNCSLIREVIIPDQVTHLGSYVFANCQGLNSVKIGKGITEISQYAFMGCSSLQSIDIPENVTELNLNSFASTNLQSITIQGMDVYMESCGITSNTNTTVYGHENSTAQEYCEKHGVNFKTI